MTDMLLEVKDLHTKYGKSQVLYGVSLSAAKGEVTCVLGRNGVGKTTTLKSIIGLVPRYAGSIRYKGQEVAGLAPYRVARMGLGYVPEERRIFPTLTVRENLLMGTRPANDLQDRAWSIDEVLEYFPGLQHRVNSKGRFLSGGEQQMLAIGRALVGNPEILLVDEPTEGLAPVIVEVVEKVIRDVAGRGVGVLLVESKLAVAERLATRVYVMSKGQIVYEGNADELKRNQGIRKQYLEV